MGCGIRGSLRLLVCRGDPIHPKDIPASKDAWGSPIHTGKIWSPHKVATTLKNK